MYTRRKQLAGCANTKDTGWPIVKKNCSCNLEDFECESGFTRSVEHMSCLPERQSNFLEDEEGKAGVCKDRESYDLDRYRKISGDSCTGGFKPEKFRVDCKALKEQAMIQRNNRI